MEVQGQEEWERGEREEVEEVNMKVVERFVKQQQGRRIVV